MKKLIFIMMMLPLLVFGQGNFFFNQHGQAFVDIGDSVLVFQICNSNSVRDDNFDIYINDTYIGFVDLSVDDQVGSLFRGTDDESYILIGDFVCPITGMNNYYFDQSLLIEGTNTIFMDNVQNNGAGNAGTIGVRHYAISGNDLINPRVIDDLSFNGASGSDFTLNFTYP